MYLSPLFAAILGVSITLRLRGEVTSGRAEAVLSRPVSRTRWLFAYPLAGVLASFALLVAFGLGIAVTRLGADPRAVGSLAVAGPLRAPAAWVFIAFTTFLLATVPRAANVVAFSVIGAFQAFEFAVEFRALPTASLAVSPFALVPQIPGGDPHPGQTVVLILIAAAFGAVAAGSITRRDIA